MLTTLSIIITIFVSCLGAILSSYFAASIMRETGLTKANGARSHCDSCGKQLTWLELIPVVSFLALRGKCSKCGNPISPQIFMAEVLGLVLFAILGMFAASQITTLELGVGVILSLVIQLIASGFLLYLAIYDLFTMTIPAGPTNRFVMFAVGVNVIILAINLVFPNQLVGLNLGSFGNLFAGLLAGGFIYALIKITRQKGIGVGDLYLAIVVGLMLGWPSIISAFYAMVFSATVVGLIYAYRKKQYRGLLVPLVPFIALGYLVGLTWGTGIFRFLFAGIPV